MSSTLLLDTVTWDWVVDSEGNWAVADEPYALAQDVSSQVRLFSQDCYYDQSQGIQYFNQVLGKYLPLQLLKSQIQSAALEVPEIVTATCVITNFADRNLSGYVKVSTQLGINLTVEFQ